MERKLATIRRINEIKPIEGADAIELAIVDGWKVVVAKNVGHKVGDFIIYCEIDSFLPIKEEFEFLRKTSYRKMRDQEGFALRTIKLRGQVSQGLIMPIYILKPLRNELNANIDLFLGEELCVSEKAIGLDVSKALGIIKYEPPIPAELSGKVKGFFPSFIPKTDEERIQNLADVYETFKEETFYVTEKLDGTSATFYFKDEVFGVCTRNLELIETEENTLWKVARKLDLENKMKSLGYNVSFQGELVGEGIQGNSYKIKGQTIFFFNVFNIDTQEYVGLTDFVNTIHGLELDTVPKIDTNFKLPENIDDLLKYSDAKSQLNPSFDREGVVIRSLDRKVSFKVISNKFLLNEK